MTIRISIPAQPAFGTPASIEPRRLFRLPPVMQREGMLLLREMGQNVDQIAIRLGLPAQTVQHMLDDESVPPFRRRDENDE